MFSDDCKHSLESCLSTAQQGEFAQESANKSCQKRTFSNSQALCPRIVTNTTSEPCRPLATCVARCRGVRRIVHWLKLLLREQARDEQFSHCPAWLTKLKFKCLFIIFSMRLSFMQSTHIFSLYNWIYYMKKEVFNYGIFIRKNSNHYRCRTRRSQRRMMWFYWLWYCYYLCKRGRKSCYYRTESRKITRCQRRNSWTWTKTITFIYTLNRFL